MSRAPLWLCLLICTSALADEPAPTLPPQLALKTFSDVLAAHLCKRKGYPYFVKVGKDRYFCLASNYMQPDAQDADSVIEQAAQKLLEQRQ